MRDAEIVDPDRRGWRKVTPRYPPDVWVRVEGRWRAGWVHAWFQDTRGRWYAWLFYDVGQVASQPALFVYDPQTIRERNRDEQPPDG